MCIDGGSHLGVVDWSGGSKWDVWFFRRCWLRFCSDVVGGQRGIRCVFGSGEWVYRGLVVIVNFLRYGWRRGRKSSSWYRWWTWCDRCWYWSGRKSFGWSGSVYGWVGVASLLGSGPNSRCWFMGTQSEQLLFKRQDTLFRGELENADCRVGRYIQQERVGSRGGDRILSVPFIETLSKGFPGDGARNEMSTRQCDMAIVVEYTLSVTNVLLEYFTATFPMITPTEMTTVVMGC